MGDVHLHPLGHLNLFCRPITRRLADFCPAVVVFVVDQLDRIPLVDNGRDFFGQGIANLNQLAQVGTENNDISWL